MPVFIATTDVLLYRQDDEYGHWPECWTCGYNLTGKTSGVWPECRVEI